MKFLRRHIFVTIILSLIIGAWIQLAYVEGAKFIWEQIRNYQTLLTWVPILIAAFIAYRGIQLQIQKANDRIEEERQRKQRQIATLFAAAASSAAGVFNMNAEILEKNPCCSIDPISLATYEKLLMVLGELPEHISKSVIHIFEVLRVENPMISGTNTIIQNYITTYLATDKNASAEGCGTHIRKKFGKELDEYAPVMWDYAQIFYSLANWLDYFSKNGDEMSLEDVVKKFGKLTRIVPGDGISEAENQRYRTIYDDTSNAKEGTPEYCAHKTLGYVLDRQRRSHRTN